MSTNLLILIDSDSHREYFENHTDVIEFITTASTLDTNPNKEYTNVRDVWVYPCPECGSHEFINIGIDHVSGSTMKAYIHCRSFLNKCAEKYRLDLDITKLSYLELVDAWNRFCRHYKKK